MKLNNWSICLTPTRDYYAAPETRPQSLRGVRETDGKKICTSAIKGKRQGKIVTQHSEYELGDIDPVYETTFPNAAKLFLESCPEV